MEIGDTDESCWCKAQLLIGSPPDSGWFQNMNALSKCSLRLLDDYKQTYRRRIIQPMAHPNQIHARYMKNDESDDWTERRISYCMLQIAKPTSFLWSPSRHIIKLHCRQSWTISKDCPQIDQRNLKYAHPAQKVWRQKRKMSNTHTPRGKIHNNRG